MADQVNYNYLDLLNDQQREAVVYDEGPALVIAGAGSGKTRVLTYKIVDLLRHGYEPWRILALTFTNKAAREMKERIIQMVGPKVGARLWMGTFHSIFLRILRQHADLVGFKPGFTIYDTNDSRSLIKIIIRDLGLDEKVYKPASVASAISNAKNAMLSPAQYRDQYLAIDTKARRPMISSIFEAYANRCRVANAMDFDDILVYMNILLRDNPDIQRHYRDYFRYILVDEYQDTNFAQHLVISQLSGGGEHLCVVGDDAQSIYSFRGADIANILNLEKRYPGLRVFKLERNYRSTQNIINAAGSLIDKNTRQMRKHVYSENAKGDPVGIIKTYSDIEEAFVVANLITQSKLTRHDSLEDYAILYRTNAQSRVLEESLRKRNIAYRIYGGLSFYQRKEIKDMTSYFRLAINPDDDEALRRIINYPARGIGDTTMKKLQDAANSRNLSLWGVINHAVANGLDTLNKGTLRKLEDFARLIQGFVDDNNKGSNAFELGQLIYNRTGILTSLAHDNTPESISRQENLTELLTGLKDFIDLRIQSGEGDTDMRAFMSEVMLATDQDQTDDDNQPKVTMMTIHAAKGLEFKHIIIVGAEEELLPSSMSMDSPSQVEEERRLLYVAITRAKETCNITYAGSRFRNGQTTATRPSRFLADIDTRYLKMYSSSQSLTGTQEFARPTDNYAASTRRTPFGSDQRQPLYRNTSEGTLRTTRRQHDRPSAPAGMKPLSQVLAHKPNSGAPSEPVRVGTVIAHDRYGQGTVTELDQFSGEPTMMVDFGAVGSKKLLLKFAKFKVLSF